MALGKRKSDAAASETRAGKKSKHSTDQVSSLPKEEAPFPRGGGSVLTPLEYKQVQIQAKQDVLFEQRTGRKAPKQDFEDEENEQAAEKSANGISRTKSRKSKKTHSKREGDGPTKKQVRIEGLSYKRLVPGSLVLGQVSRINRDDVTLSLPNNLSGFIPITSISSQISQKLESLVADDKSSVESLQEDRTSTDVDLDKLFHQGQFLRAYVVSTQEDEALGGRGRRHIELSIVPEQTNAGLSSSDCVNNSMLQASVVSIEDHGLVMELGLSTQGVRGFIPVSELGSIELSRMEIGSVFLCLITGRSSNGKIVQMSLDAGKISDFRKTAYVADTTSIDSLLPGTAIDFLVSQVTSNGIAGKFMGLLDVTCDLIHSGFEGIDPEKAKKFQAGNKAKARVLCTFPSAEEKKLGISVKDHILYWRVKAPNGSEDERSLLPTKILPVSSIVDQARVVSIEPDIGLFLDVGVPNVQAFAHISRISDDKLEVLSESAGPYKVDSIHKCRVTGYNLVDGLFIVSLEPSVISQPFLHIEDVRIGQLVSGKIGKIIVNESGVGGVIVELAKGISGLVPEPHLADVRLQHPERKFREGMTVAARVLAVYHEKRQIRLTLKKTLVNSDARPWTEYKGLSPGMQSPGTIINLLSNGAVVQFYGSVRGFLPVSEMSESFIRDPKQHFQKGQVLTVHILSIDAAEHKMTVSCKDPATSSMAQQTAIGKLRLGETVTGQVLEKHNDEVILQLDGQPVRAILPFEHLVDGSTQKVASAAKKIRVGQSLKDLIVLSKNSNTRFLRLTSKPSLIKAARERMAEMSIDDVSVDSLYPGYVNNVTQNGVFVRLGGDLTGFLPKAQISEENLKLPDFGFRRDQSITVKVVSTNPEQGKVLLTNRLQKDQKSSEASDPKLLDDHSLVLKNPVDGVSNSLGDFTLGKITQAKVVSVKETQLNVLLADGVQGRIDASEIFDNWSEIRDRKHPLKVFSPNQTLPVRILGVHDSRNHRFLPVSHRQGKTPVFELTAKSSNLANNLEILSIDKIEMGSFWLVVVNNVKNDYIWVNLSPNVRGRIRLTDISDDISLLKNVAQNFPTGSVLRAKVINIDAENNHLDLTGRRDGSSKLLSMQDLSPGMVLPGRVTKVTERLVMIQLSETISGALQLIDMSDDYSLADPSTYQKNQTVRVCIKEIDEPNKRIVFSTRPSRVLSSSLPVKDPEIKSTSQLHVNDIVRGFVKNVADQGLFVTLSSSIIAFVRVSDLSDDFLKDWKSNFTIDQLMEGKIIAVDEELNHVQMSLKRSHLEKEYIQPLTFADMRVGQIVDGKIRKVQDFGVFVVVENSTNVSGLCHRTKISDRPDANPRTLYEEGDVVKAKVLDIDHTKQRISFGLKASYFSRDAIIRSKMPDGAAVMDYFRKESDNKQSISAYDASDVDSDGDESHLSEADGGVELRTSNNQIEELDDIQSLGSDSEAGSMELDPSATHSRDELHIQLLSERTSAIAGLNTGGFDWTGGLAGLNVGGVQSDTEMSDTEHKKKKRRKAEIKVDKTGDLDAHGPQSVADFERLLLGQPNSSILWLSYMAFHLQLSEISKAREIGERALKIINIREEGEKLNVWVALLNLENTYGTDNTLDEVFKRACQYNDSQEIHERLTSIYIQSGHHEKADELFQATLKKFSQSPTLYLNYATFLFTTLSDSDRARALLPRAMQTLPSTTHVNLTSKFGQLEFKHGDPERGRTIFETLVSQWPKRLDLWNVWIDTEVSLDATNCNGIRRLFERVTASSGHRLKPKKAKFFFKRWMLYEEKHGDVRNVERVKALAAEYIKGYGDEGRGKN